jgi:hypothetical protein
MGKAKEYGIKRAVIYNESKYANNPMYDFNRQILVEDRTVIRIDSDNVIETVKKLLPQKIIQNPIFFKESLYISK